MIQEKRLHVAIIGGGIAGPALALCLKKLHGISCSIYERLAQEDVRGVNIALGPNAVRVLQHAGVYHQLRGQGCSYEKLSILNAQGQELGSILNGSEKHYNYAALRLHRAKVQKALLEDCKAQGVEVNFSMKLSNLEETDTHVKLNFETGQTVEADFVVGADGIHSKVRPYIFDCELEYSGYAGIIGMTVKKASLHDSAKDVHFPSFCYGKSGFVAMMTANYTATELDFFSTFPYNEMTSSEWTALDKDKDKLHNIVMEKFGTNWPTHIEHVCKEYPKERLTFWPFYEVPPLDRWTSPKGRIIMIGDSVHAITPQAGQGAAMALEDAESLAFTIARANFDTDYLRMLRLWERHRQERVIAVKNFTKRNGRLRQPESTWIIQYVKEWIMWSFLKFSGKTSGLSWLYDYSGEDIVGLLDAGLVRNGT